MPFPVRPFEGFGQISVRAYVVARTLQTVTPKMFGGWTGKKLWTKAGRVAPRRDYTNDSDFDADLVNSQTMIAVLVTVEVKKAVAQKV